MSLRTLFASLALCGALWGCPPPDPDPEPDAGSPPPDVCNSLEEALGDPQCVLTLGEEREGYLSFAGDQDWYSFQVPSDANARTLVHVTGGYPVPNTAVNLSLNLLRENGEESLARKSDQHGQAAPRPVDIILPFSEPDARLVLLVADDPVNPSRPNFDVRAPYVLRARVLQDPDVNEPNDDIPTPIALTPQGEALVGTQSGYLSTAGDVDRFSFQVPSGKKLVYVRITAPALAPEPPPPFRVSYELFDPEGTRIAEGTVLNEFLAVDLATVRLSKGEGTYTVAVRGYAGAGHSGPVPGDLRLEYTVDARVYDEVDPSEGPNQNDTLETATPISFGAVGETQTRTGRIGYVPDPDWFRIELAPSNVPTRLRYRLRPGTGTGRFPALPGEGDRELRVLRQVQTGGTAQDDVTACLNDRDVCPKSFGNDPYLTGLTQEQCQNHSPPRCIWSLRFEHPSFGNLRNFEGIIPIPPHASNLALYALVQDQQNNWADDVDYTLTFEWLDDPDDAARWNGSSETTVTRALAEDPAASTFPVPPTGAAYEVTGRLSHGYGYFRDHNPNQGQGVRGPMDYDAVTSDTDRYEFTLPALDPDAGYLDRTWEIEWEVAKMPDGGRPYDLAIELEFCDGDRLTGSGECTPVRTGSRGGGLVLSYTGEPRNAWHNVGAGASARQPVYDRTETAGATITTARAYGCFCFEPRFIKGGKFRMTVLGVDRRSYEDTPYTLRTAYTDYPKSYPVDGGTASCPPPGPDAGCWFTREP